MAASSLLIFPLTTQTRAAADKFWSRVDKSDNPNECWEWTMRGRRHGGYGQVHFLGRSYGAHILAWTLHNEREPALLILHSCDNRICCNPSHLREGTQQENSDDMVNRRRSTFGTRHHNSKLTESEVLQIRELAMNRTFSQKKIGEMFGVSQVAVRDIKFGYRWGYLLKQEALAGGTK